RAGRLSNLRAPRPARLPSSKPSNMKTRPADSRYERGNSGGQVTSSKPRNMKTRPADSRYERGSSGGQVIHRNGHVKLSDKKIKEGSAEFYANDPLKNIHDWLWRFCLFFSQPAFEEPFRDAFKVAQDNREKPEFVAFFEEYDRNLASSRAEKYLAIIREFFLGYDVFSQVIFRVKKGLKVDEDAGVSSAQFDKTKMFYGNAFETFSSLVDIMAYLNNVTSGRSFDQFQTLTRKKYLELDKSARFGPFDNNPALANLCVERDNQLRNASHHASIKLVTPDNKIVYRSGKGGTGPEQEMGYAAYLAKCSILFLQIINLFRFEVMLFEVHGKRFPA
ncbi:hypothetical protein, partial [Tropicimonas sp. IMCC6043]|uniref:hypothetical protein n=1 Tax=Tropicimonas sp. IMCC6043 TaxID=2510645 RepID=UPI001A91587B